MRKRARTSCMLCPSVSCLFHLPFTVHPAAAAPTIQHHTHFCVCHNLLHHVTQSSPYLRVGIRHPYCSAHHPPDFCKTSSSSFPRNILSLMLSSLPSECPLASAQSLRLKRRRQSTNSPKPDSRSSTNRTTIASTSMLRHTQAEHFL